MHRLRIAALRAEVAAEAATGTAAHSDIRESSRDLALRSDIRGVGVAAYLGDLAGRYDGDVGAAVLA